MARAAQGMGGEELKALDETEKRVRSLSFAEAQEQALELLLQDREFAFELQSSTVALPEQLPDGLRQLFRQYRVMTWSFGVASVGLDYWMPFLGSDANPISASNGYYVIGTDAESPLVVRAFEERVYVYNINAFSDSYASIYHWILQLS